MREVPSKFVADDGTEYDTKEEAGRHDTFVGAAQNLERAQEQFTRAIAETQRTADGYLYSFRRWDYFRIQDLYGSMPQVIRVSIRTSVGRMNINHENAIEFSVWMDDPRGDTYGHWLKLRFDELYVDEPAANAACLEKQRARLAEIAEDVDNYAKEVAKRRRS